MKSIPVVSEDLGRLSNSSICDTWKRVHHHVNMRQDKTMKWTGQKWKGTLFFTIWRDGRKSSVVNAPRITPSDCDLADGMKKKCKPNNAKGTCNKLLSIHSSLQSLSVSNVKSLHYREMRSTNVVQLNEVIMNSHRGPCWHPHNVITTEAWQNFIQQATAVSN